MGCYYVSLPHWGVFKVTQEEFYSMYRQGFVIDDNFLIVRKH